MYTTDTLIDNLFATTKMDGVETKIPFSNDTITIWQSKEPKIGDSGWNYIGQPENQPGKFS